MELRCARGKTLAALKPRPQIRGVEVLGYIFVALAAYLLGSVPTGFLAGKARGVDIRKVGSGNIGGTNVLRTLGKPIGITVMALDALKGWLAVVCIAPFLAHALGWQTMPAWAPLLAGISAVLGHNYTCWLGFKGGKGIATSGGAFLALAPASAGLAIGVWGIAFVLTRYVSVASIVAAATLGIGAWLLPNPIGVRVLATLLAVLAIWKHKANIQRLMNGTEHRFGSKPGAPQDSK